MILNEEVFDILDFDVPDVANADIEVADMDATVPEAGPEVGVETLLMQAIKDIYGIIEGYNSLSIALTDIGNEPAAISVADIIKIEYSNIGVLQDILAEISPNAEAIDINESLNEVLHDDIPVEEIDVDRIIPTKKDMERAEGLAWRGSTFKGSGAPWGSEAAKMAKLIKDPLKLVRRAKAVVSYWDKRGYISYYSDYYGRTVGPDKESDVWEPFRERLMEMGFSTEQINKIRTYSKKDGE